MKFTKVADKLHIAENITIKVATISGATRPMSFHFRIDGREGGGYRVDVMKPLIPVWEAIDGGNPVKTIAEAKALCRAFRQGGAQ